jgi:hypothetical protein
MGFANRFVRRILSTQLSASPFTKTNVFQEISFHIWLGSGAFKPPLGQEELVYRIPVCVLFEDGCQIVSR